MSALLLMRHGEPNYRNGTGELTERGLRQVRIVAKELIEAGIRPDIIISSDLPRAKHTARVLAEELMLVGMETVMSVDERLKEMETTLRNGGIQTGIRGALSELNNKYQTVAIISHKDELAQAAVLLTGQSLSLGYAQAGLVKCYEDTWANSAGSNLNMYERTFMPNPNHR